MAEKIKDVITGVQNDSTKSREQKEKAKKVLDLLTQKRKQNLEINTDARTEILEILTEITLDNSLSTEIIEGNLLDGTSSVENSDTPSDTGNETAQEYERQGWDNAYIFAKMLSLGYIPKFHDMKFQKEFSGKKISWVWNNSRYLALGGVLTNGTVNTPFVELQKNMTESLMKMFIGEKKQLEILLKLVPKADEFSDKTKITERLRTLNNLQTAINTGNVAGMQTASREYADISEKDGNIKDLFKKYGVSQTVKTELDKQKGDKEGKERKKQETKIQKQKETILIEFDRQISAEQAKLDTATDTTALQKDLDRLNDEKIRLESQKQFYNDRVIKYEAEYSKVIAELDKIGTSKKGGGISPERTRLLNDLTRLRGDIRILETNIDTKNTEIGNKQGEIIIKEREIRDLGKTNKVAIDEAKEKKAFLEKLRTATETGDHKEAKRLLQEYKRKNPSAFELVPGVGHEKFMKTDQKTEVDEKVKNATRVSQLATKQVIQNEKTRAIKTEVGKITTEIQKIEKEIDTIKQEATKKLQELEIIAQQDPKQVPTLKAEIEATVGKMNTKISELELKGVEGLKKIDIKTLGLLEKKSKWTAQMIQVNGGIDKISSGFTGKILGVSAIALLGKGVYDGVDNNGLTQTTALNITDLGIGMIPVAGGIYDIAMAARGKDLNGGEMQTSERLTRLGFGVIGLVPLVGTAVRWGATAGKFGSTAADITKMAQRGELITQTGHVVGKVSGGIMLGYGGITTFTYMLPQK